MLTCTCAIAKVEHYVVSTIASVIPEPVRVKIRGYWEAFKNRGKEELQDQDQDKKDMVGWGVEQAQERYAEEASTFVPLTSHHPPDLSFLPCALGERVPETE